MQTNQKWHGFRPRAAAILRRHVASSVLAVVSVQAGFCLDPGLSISQYLRTSWTQESGNALPPLNAITQGAKSFIWLGTDRGLLRFDGMQFTPWSPPNRGPALTSDLSFLLPSTTGLWVGTSS